MVIFLQLVVQAILDNLTLIKLQDISPNEKTGNRHSRGTEQRNPKGSCKSTFQENKKADTQIINV